MPLPSTMTPIATSTLSANATTVTFSNIPQTYTDLFIVVNMIGVGASNPGLRFNSDGGANYSASAVSGSGTAASSYRYTNDTNMKFHNSGANFDNVWNTFTGQVMNYSNSTTNKTVLARLSSNEVDAAVGLWRSTAAITSVSVITHTNNFGSGSTFTIYGVKSA
jgi:hypothetical protein